MNLQKSLRIDGQIMDPKIYLCNSIGVSFGFPEPEAFKVASYLSHKGYRVWLEDLRISVYLRLKELFSKEISKRISKNFKASKLMNRVVFEETNGLIEDYLYLASRSIHYHEPDSSDFDYKKNLLESVRNILWEEFSGWKKKILSVKPDIICFFITPRKVRENTKKSNQPLEAEFIFPLLMIDELNKDIKNVYLLGCDLPSDSITLMFQRLNHPFNLDRIVYKNFAKNIELIAKNLEERGSLPLNLPGIIYWDFHAEKFKANPIVYSDKMDYIIPDYSLTDLNKYFNIYSSPLSLLVDGSISCPLKCAFCNVRYLYGPYRQREAFDLVEEMLFYQNNYNIVNINFNDRIFNADIERLREFCRLLIKKKYPGVWNCYANIRPEINKVLLKKMHAAGCNNITFGVESGSPRVLKKMNKNYTPELASQVIRDTCQCSIRVQLEIMTDFPGEEEGDFKQTLLFIKENFNYIYDFRINQFETYPGCDVYINPSKYGLKQQDLCKNFKESLRLARIRKYIANLEKERTK